MSMCAVEAQRVAKHLYNLEVLAIERLKGYDGHNFFLQVQSKTSCEENTPASDCSFVLKFLPSKESVCQTHHCQLNIMRFLNNRGFPCPQPVASKQGKLIQKFPKDNNMQDDDKPHSLLPVDEFLVTLLKYIPGDMLSSLHPVPYHLFYEAGQMLATLHGLTKNYDGDIELLRASSHQWLWSLEQLPQLVNFLWVLEDDWLKSVIPEIVSNFKEKVLPWLSELPKGVIHGDFNDDNIIISRRKQSSSELLANSVGPDTDTNVSISGIIDFGDAYFSCLIFDVAIALSFMVITDVPDIMEAARIFLKGYASKRKLLQQEKDVLFTSVVAHLAQNIVLALHDYRLDPSNEYFLESMDDYPIALRKLLSCTEFEINKKWQL